MKLTWPNKIFIGLSALIGGIIIHNYLIDVFEPEWPTRGQIEIIELFSKDPKRLDIFYSTWMNENRPDLLISEFYALGPCKIDTTKIEWYLGKDVLNGTARCQRGSYMSEYSIQVFQNGDTAYGH